MSTATVEESERKARKVATIIAMNAHISRILTLLALVISAALIFSNDALPSEKKVFFGTVLGVCALALQVVLCVAGKDESALVLFTTLSAFLSGLVLGLGIVYA